MRSLLAFMKKELVAHVRSPKPIIITAVVVLIAVMNPIFAKITPLLFEILEESGLSVGEITVSALDSWVQFYKNLPIIMIAFFLMEGNAFTKEYQSGTLILTLSKGIERYKIIVANTTVLTVFWTLEYWLCYAITYVVTGFFFDNSALQNIGFAAFASWIFGVFVIALIVLSSAIFNTYGGVLFSTGGIIAVFYILMLVPKINKFFPTMLLSGTGLISGSVAPADFVPSIIIASVLSVLAIGASVPIFNKKQL